MRAVDNLRRRLYERGPKWAHDWIEARRVRDLERQIRGKNAPAFDELQSVKYRVLTYEQYALRHDPGRPKVTMALYALYRRSHLEGQMYAQYDLIERLSRMSLRRRIARYVFCVPEGARQPWYVQMMWPIRWLTSWYDSWYGDPWKETE